MSKYLEIFGGVPLSGTVQISGAKNAALPMLMATLLSTETCYFERVPNLEDVNITVHLLESLGAEIEYFGNRVQIRVPNLRATEANYSLVKALRASFWVLGPLLARGHAARVAFPGGDIIGARPVDMHLSALTQMGADIVVKHGVVYATAVNGLKPAQINFRFPSVGATHQVLMAASLTPGTTVIDGAAREPEVVSLAEMLIQMGADIEGAGTPNIVIRGKSELGGARMTLIGDRIEAGTYLLAALASSGQVTTQGVHPKHLGEFVQVLEMLGAEVVYTEDSVSIKAPKVLKPINVSTGPFPKLATDLQAPLMALLAKGQSESTIEEHVFEGRFGHVSELCRMGANIIVEDRIARIKGVERLTGAPVDGHDIRAAASLVIAALGAEGITQIHEIHHLRRGYEQIENKLSSLGARVCIKQDDTEDYLFAGC